MKQSPFACNMSAIPAELRNEHIEKIKVVFGSVKKIKEIQNGYAFLLPADSQSLLNLVLFIDKERLCCPFFGFTIQIEPEEGDVWLQVFGREGVKDFIKLEFGEFLSPRLFGF